MTGWEEIWRTQTDYGATASLRITKDEHGDLKNGEIFIEKHHALSNRTTTVSVTIPPDQIERLLKALEEKTKKK